MGRGRGTCVHFGFSGTRTGVDENHGETLITPYRDGPLLVRGPVRIQTQEGDEIRVDRAVVALCRCGKSRNRPLCDGTHKLIQFRAPSALESGRAAMPDSHAANRASAKGSVGGRNGLGE